MSAKKKKQNTGLPADADKVQQVQTSAHTDYPFKEEILAGLLSIVVSLLIYGLVALAILHFYHPDIDALRNYAASISIVPPRPEPEEALLFRAGVFTILGSIICFYLLFSRSLFVKRMAHKPLFNYLLIVAVLLIIALAYAGFAAANPFGPLSGEKSPQNTRDFTSNTNFDFFFDGLFLGSNFLLYNVLFLPLICGVFFWGFRKYKWDTFPQFNRVFTYLASGIAAIIIAVLVASNTFYFPYAHENKYNLNAVYYSMTQVYAGSPLLINGFANTYGLYPHFLNPLFQLTGLSVLKFSLCMSILLGLSFAMNFYFLKKQVNDSLILILGFLSIVFFPQFNAKLIGPFDSVFSLWGIRYIIPSSLAVISLLYFTRRSKWIYYLATTLSAFFVLWNPEIGLVCFVAWLAVNSYHDFYTATGTINFRKILLHILTGISFLVLAFSAYALVIYTCYGSIPDLRILFQTIFVFSQLGFGLLPMSLIHPWNLMALIIIAGFTYSIAKLIKKEITVKASLVFLLSIISLGFLVYFQGRSHNWSLAFNSGFCLMLLTVLTDELWMKIKDKSIVSLDLLFAVLIYIPSVAFFETLFNAEKIYGLIYQEADRTAQSGAQKTLTDNADFVLQKTKKGERIYAFTAIENQGLYFNGSKRFSAFNPGLGEIFLNSDIKRMEQQLRDSAFPVFIDPVSCNYDFMAGPFAAMAATYEVADSGSTIAMLKKRQQLLPSDKFLDSTDTYIYRKYTNDVSGINARIADAAGMPPLILSEEFSAEVLFNSKTQIFQFATLLANMDSTSGFTITRDLHFPGYYFGFNGKRMAVRTPDNTWIYFVLNVYKDHVEIYVNGKAIATIPIPEPFRNSPERFYIGNQGFGRNYVGAIAEIAIHNKPLDKEQVLQTTKNITAGFQGQSNR